MMKITSVIGVLTICLAGASFVQSHTLSEVSSSAVSVADYDQQGRKAGITLRGTVVNRETRYPVGGATVKILGTKYSTRSASDGQFVIESIAPGIYQLEAWADGYQAQVLNNRDLRNQREVLVSFELLREMVMPSPGHRENLPELEGGIASILRLIQFPESARRDSVEGTVLVRALVSPEGKVIKTEVVQGVREDVDNAATSAVGQARFKRTDNTVPVSVMIPVRFRLGK